MHSVSRLEEALAIVETLTAGELVEFARKVATLRNKLPMQLSNVPSNMEGKFTIFDKCFIDEAPEFEFSFDAGHCYKLVWKNGEEMDLKLVNKTGFIAARTMMCEIQGLQVGPLIITASFPESDQLPSDSSAQDLEKGVAELVRVCKKHNVEFGDSEEFTSFVDWLMQDVMDGSNQFLYGIVVYGALSDAYENLYGQADGNA